MRCNSCIECKFYSLVIDSPNLYDCTFSAETEDDIVYFEQFCCNIVSPFFLEDEVKKRGIDLD